MWTGFSIVRSFRPFASSGAFDLAPAVGHVAEAVLGPGEADQPLGRALVEDRLADRTVEHGAGVLVVAEQEGDVGDQRVGHEVADRAGRGHHQVDRAELRALGHLALAAELEVREQLELVAAAHALGDQLLHVLRAGAVMGLRRETESEAQRGLGRGCGRGRAQRRRDGDAAKECGAGTVHVASPR
jgi:hypothetical protein